ncbi:uncharacterized protein LOC142009367 isoform X4 [Carettochelys insculpta]|uniref:uncharacterized protein LOC142009367 isoform X4 n=1 Tax=Carettochelys insculpta TaxID=44489 RepID=UPI003EBA0BF2
MLPCLPPAGGRCMAGSLPASPPSSPPGPCLAPPSLLGQAAEALAVNSPGEAPGTITRSSSGSQPFQECSPNHPPTANPVPDPHRSQCALLEMREGNHKPTSSAYLKHSVDNQGQRLMHVTCSNML